MSIFKRKPESRGVFYEEERLDSRFDEMMMWIKDLNRRDYNRLKKAMDLDYNAYQSLHGIEPDEDAGAESAEYMLTKEDK